MSYAESDDGVTWRKPRLGFVEIDGQDTNVVIRRGAAEGEPNALPHFYEIFGVHKNEHATDASRRYVMGFLSLDRQYRGPRNQRFHAGQRRGLGVAASSDGIHWRLLESWATEAICDGDTHWMFDPRADKFVLYGRTKQIDPGLLEAWRTGRPLDDWVQRYYWGGAWHASSRRILCSGMSPSRCKRESRCGMPIFTPSGLQIDSRKRSHTRLLPRLLLACPGTSTCQSVRAGGRGNRHAAISRTHAPETGQRVREMAE